MVDPGSEAYEIWYAANLALAILGKQWQQEITKLERDDDRDRYAARLQEASKAMLQRQLLAGGADAKKIARNGTRQQMIDFLLADRAQAFAKRIAYLQQQITDNQPDPRWRER
jgi:hypothetical protein